MNSGYIRQCRPFCVYFSDVVHVYICDIVLHLVTSDDDCVVLTICDKSEEITSIFL